jgi:hypothetical protein
MKKYPDVSELIEKKKAHRRSLAALPFEEKIEMVFKLRERREFIKSGRVASKQKLIKKSRETCRSDKIPLIFLGFLTSNTGCQIIRNYWAVIIGNEEQS